MRNNHQIIEEPCEVKVSCTVLKTSGTGDSLAEFNEYYTDSNGVTVENPRFLIKGEKVLKRCQRRVSKKIKGSNNRGKTRQILGKRHLKITRQPHCTML